MAPRKTKTADADAEQEPAAPVFRTCDICEGQYPSDRDMCPRCGHAPR